MKVLCLIPPYVPSYFNAGHHLPVFQVAAYLRQVGGCDVTVRDFGAANATWRDVCDLLVREFDVVAMMDDYDAVEGHERLVRYAREIAPRSRLLTFGRGSRQVPHFFERFDLDAILWSGDYEAGVAAYVDYVRGGPIPAGVLVRETGFAPAAPGLFLEAKYWVLPDVGEIPYEAYDRLYADDMAKFCGVPQRRELVVPVARGCPVGCAFCDVPAQQGLRERRLEVSRVVAYISACLAAQPFDYASFYAPTFTLKRNWVGQLCNALRAELPTLKWKCVTTLFHLDEDLLQRMAEAGCVRVSVGVETLYPEAKAQLPVLKQEIRATLERIGTVCDDVGIELNCFLMVGMPGEPIHASASTIGELIARGFRVRPTVFTPYEQMRSDMGVADFSAFNRQLLHGERAADERAAAYALLYANSDDRPTAVAERIPRRRSAA